VTARRRSLAEGFGIGKEKIRRRHRPLPRPPMILARAPNSRVNCRPLSYIRLKGKLYCSSGMVPRTQSLS
jgi:hypothetical protein